MVTGIFDCSARGAQVGAGLHARRGGGSDFQGLVILLDACSDGRLFFRRRQHQS